MNDRCAACGSELTKHEQGRNQKICWMCYGRAEDDPDNVGRWWLGLLSPEAFDALERMHPGRVQEYEGKRPRINPGPDL